MKYKVFIRTWYDAKGNPCAGRKTHLAWAYSEEEARRICSNYNTTHKPGKRSRKAEYTSNY